MYLSNSVVYYDKIYASQGKDYRKEAEYVVELIRSRGIGKRATLLDVACGSGGHLFHLRKSFEVEGVDVSLDFIRAARKKVPKAKFLVGDMRTFATGKEYNVVTCMFSSIGYMDTLKKLQAAIRNMAKHLKKGGLLIVEPWFSPGQMENGSVSVTVVEEDKLKLVRMNTIKVEGNLSIFDFHYLVGTSSGTEHFVEKHKLGLYTRDEMSEAFQKCGLSVEYENSGPTGRGLYLGKKQ
jgi:ubiquinone/menaquinone biosynthesis C-methylase UbiE